MGGALGSSGVFKEVHHHLVHVEDEVHHDVLQCMPCHSKSHNLDLPEPISDSPSISTIWASSPATQSARETKIAVALLIVLVVHVCQDIVVPPRRPAATASPVSSALSVAPRRGQKVP